MAIANEFLDRLRNIGGEEALIATFLENRLPSSHEEISFETILTEYAKYVSELPNNDKERLLNIFWDQVKYFGTPIIEDNSQESGKCNVYFIFPKEDLKLSTENSRVKKDLYLQGDFHGYGVTTERQKLSELEGAGIMWRKYVMPENAMVVYKYIQVEPSDEGISPKPELPPFFKQDDERFIPVVTNVAEFPPIPSQTDCVDKYATHTSPYPGFEMPSRMFCVNADTRRAHIQSNPIKWPDLLSSTAPSDQRHFVYHSTLYSDKSGELHRSESKISEHYHDDLFFSDKPGSVYADFTRNIQVFKPASGKIEDVIILNDGIPYLMTGLLAHFEKMVDEGKLSPHTAFAFISTMPGLKNTLSQEDAIAFENDELANTPGMGVRVIDYKDHIDEYINFIADKLFPLLEKEIDIPDDPSHRVMVGSSLSGTASAYIGLKRPDLFGGVVSQSPSPANREILSTVPIKMQTMRNVYMSCGEFEDPGKAAANANLEYAKELSHKLNIPLHIGAHGHEFLAWNEELEQSLPAVIEASHALKVKESTESSFGHAHSMFSRPQKLSESEQQDEKNWVYRKKGG